MGDKNGEKVEYNITLCYKTPFDMPDLYVLRCRFIPIYSMKNHPSVRYFAHFKHVADVN